MPVLTSAAVLKYKAQKVRREIADAKAVGLFLVVQPSGSKSWALRFRKPDGRPAKMTLGPVDLAAADAERLPEKSQIEIEGIDLPRLAVAAGQAALPGVLALLT